MSQPTRLVIVAAVRLYREGIAKELERRGCEIVGAAGEVTAAAELVRELCPDIALVDIAAPGTHESVAGLVAAVPATKVVAFGVPEQPPAVLACAEAGVVGYVPREATLDDLVSGALGGNRSRRGQVPRGDRRKPVQPHRRVGRSPAAGHRARPPYHS